MVDILPNKVHTLILLILAASNLVACEQPSSSNKKQNTSQEIMTKENNQNIEPEQVVIQLIEAMSVNDAKKIRSLFNEDAKQAYGTGSWKSGDAFFSWLDSDIIARKGHVDNANYSTDDNQVTVTGQYSSEGYTNKANFLFSVKDGKIASWQMRY
jgi:hypothetical protein